MKAPLSRADKARGVVLILSAPIWIPAGAVFLAVCLVLGLFAAGMLLVLTPVGVCPCLVKTHPNVNALHPIAKLLYKLFPEDEDTKEEA